MGYTTEFMGQFTVSPPLNEAEIDYLNRFAGSRRMQRQEGEYFANPGSNFGQDEGPSVIDYNTPPPTQPGLWCQWVPTADGSAIEWDGGEKFYNAPEWLIYIINHFLMPDAIVQRRLEARSARHANSLHPDPLDEYLDEAFEKFTFDHHVTGKVHAQGEGQGDVWTLVAEDNQVNVT